MRKFLVQLIIAMLMGYPLWILYILACVFPGVTVLLAPYLLPVLVIVIVIFAIQYIIEKGLFSRLNHFFVTWKIPFLNWYMISQKVEKKFVKGKECNEVFQELDDDTPMLTKRLKYGCNYFTITHETVIRELERSGVLDDKGVRKKIYCYSTSLRSIQKQLRGHGIFNDFCRNCDKKEKCRILRAGKRKRKFYLIWFKVKNI